MNLEVYAFFESQPLSDLDELLKFLCNGILNEEGSMRYISLDNL